MWCRNPVRLLTLVLLLPSSARAFDHHAGGGGGGPIPMHGHPGGNAAGHPGAPQGAHINGGVPFAVSGGWAGFWFGWHGSWGMGFPPGMPGWGPPLRPLAFDQGMLGGPMPPGQGIPRPPIQVRKAKMVDASRVNQLVTFGDRLFRAGNLKRAEERYQQAVKANPEVAAPRIRLAQISVTRGQYAEAADQIRDAIAAEPRWLVKAGDIQALFSEPADFLRVISRLESRVLIEPNDREAWFVLGTELFLSGQTRRASDIFLRLTDRKPDPALAALLDVSNLPPEK